jgi:hypothetical protein
LIEIDCTYLLNLLEKANENSNYKQLITFLNSVIAGLDKVSRVKRDRISRSFKEKAFPPGHYLLKEGRAQNVGYIILEGECL